MNFEAFGSSPDFTTPIQEFLFNNCSKIEEAKESGEQSINNYMLFKQYSELMDKTLDKFLEMGNLDPEVFIQAMQFAKEENLPFDEITLSCKGKFPRFCVKGTKGAGLYYEMMIKGNEINITKGEDKFKEEMSAFNNQMFRDILNSNEIKRVFICGFTTEFSVGLTALDCARKEYETYVIKDACRGLAPASEAAMLKNFERKNVKVISFDEFEKIMSEEK